MTEPLFGTIGPGTAAPARPPGELRPGDKVEVLAGRLARSKAEVVAVYQVATPSGGRTPIVKIRRPRAGESWEMLSNLRPIP